jgi:hypothetical protein
MKRNSLSGVGGFIGRGIVLIGVVTLLTLLFSFLGTITCAALAGLMFGMSKKKSWRWSFVSLVFPAVIGAFFYFGKTNMPPQQSILLSLICFGAYWVTFLLTAAAPYLEQNSASSPVERTALTATSQSKSLAVPHSESRITSPATVSEKARISKLPNLEELQGMWSREATAGERSQCRKTIEVTRNQLTLRILGPDGDVRFVCQGQVRLERLGPFKIMCLVDPQPATANTSQGYDLPGTWIYQVVGETLSVASYFEDAAVGHNPAVEIFKRYKQAELSRDAEAHRCVASDHPD